METGSEFGGSLGIAVLGSVGAAMYGSRLGEYLPAGLTGDEAHDARQGLAGAVATSSHLHGRAADALLDTARSAFTVGLDVAASVGATILIAAAILTAVLLRRAE